ALVFFFQAEDGIRDFHVTGVQTCALPISKTSAFPTPSQLPRQSSARRAFLRRRASWTSFIRTTSHAPSRVIQRLSARFGWQRHRSEERRVGKEGRSRRWRGRGKEKNSGTW